MPNTSGFDYNQETNVYKIKGYVTASEFQNLSKFITRVPKAQRSLLNKLTVHLPFLKEAKFSKVIQFINGIMNPDKIHKATMAPLMASGSAHPIFHLPNGTGGQFGMDAFDWAGSKKAYNPLKYGAQALGLTTAIVGFFVDLIECQLFKGNIDIQGQQANNAAISEGLLQAFHEVLAIPHSEGGIIYSGALDRHDILDSITVKKNKLTVLHIGAAAQFGYDDYNKTIDVKGYTSVSKLFLPDPVNFIVGNSPSNEWFRPKNVPLFWPHGTVTYFQDDSPFMRDFKKWREKR